MKMESESERECSAAKKIKHNDSSSTLSKSQQKKLARRQKWLELKPLRKAKEKEKHQRKLQEAKLSGRNIGPSRKMLKVKKMTDSSCKIRVVFDLSFDRVMTQFELSKTLKQLNRCYSFNRRASAPLQLHITGYSDSIDSTMSELGILNWDVHISKAPFEDIMDKKTVVYLSSESSNTLNFLEDNKVYVIGALVDHNRLKGTCHKKALDLGIAHAKLPLDEYIKMDGRKVLTIDQVYLILLRVSEGKSWNEAFLEVIPKRKGAVLKTDPKSVSDVISSAPDTKNSSCNNLMAGDLSDSKVKEKILDKEQEKKQKKPSEKDEC